MTLAAERISQMTAGAESKPATRAPGPLRLSQKLIYATGDVVEGGINGAQATFLLFYLTAVCGLSGSLAGAALFLTLLVDSFVDPLVGFLSDNTRSRLGRRHPFLLAAALPLGLMVALLFNVPRGLQGWPLFAYVVGVLMVQRMLQSTFLLPYAALGAEISRDYRERSSVGAFRTLLNGLGNLTMVALGFGVFMKGQAGLLDARAYSHYGWIVAMVIVGFALTCGVGTLPLRGRLQRSLFEHPPTPAAFVREVGEAARNRSFLTLFFTIIIFWVAQGTAITLALHAYKFFWNAPNSLLQILPAFTMIGGLTGVPIAALMLRRMEKQQVCVTGVILYCIAQFTPATLRLFGFLPGEAAVRVVLPVAALLLAWAMAAIGVSFLSMMADCADEHEHLFGARREALFFAGTLFSTKASIAVGALIGGLMLDVIGFPHDIAKLGPHPHLAPETVRSLGLITGPGAAALAVLCIFILSRYSLDARRVGQIQAELADRRRAASPV